MKPAILFTTFMVGCIAVPTTLQARDTSACPYYLPDGAYEFPHHIVPINDSEVALGNSYFATITPDDYATIFNFDIPSSRADQKCTVYFTFPRHDQLTTSNFTWTGDNTSPEKPGTLSLVQYAYNTGATDVTTGRSQPPLGPGPAVTLSGVIPGNAYKVWSGSCGTGGVMSWRLSSPDSCLQYFQDWNPCAIGLWVVYEEVLAAPGPQCNKCPSVADYGSHAAWMEAYTSDGHAW